MTETNDDIILRKINRLRNPQAKLRTVDLFAGAGGFSLGFHSASRYELLGAVEFNEPAQTTHRENFGRKSDFYSLFGNIKHTQPDQVVQEYLSQNPDENVESAVDVIIGGPPCQPFSLSGRAKLRQVAQDPDAFANDDRVTLYTRYLSWVARLRPLAFVMENVLGIGNHKGQNIPEEIAREVAPLGYTVRYALLNAAWYGVPQMRERMIIIGIHAALGVVPEFPPPTHHLELPIGYRTARKGTAPVRKPHPNWVKVEGVGAIPAVTVEDALKDLPSITYHLRDQRKIRGQRKFDTLSKYDPSAPLTDYARLMRGWTNFESQVGVYDHVMRHTPRDYKTFRSMKPGDQYPEARLIAQKRFDRILKLVHKRTGQLPDPKDPAFDMIHKLIVPPYDPNKYPNKWRKMESDQPARTLPAHLSKDTYSHIHYSSKQARMITVREAARLQSFPDGFVFPVSMIEAFRQIGNAVPPLMAKAIAEHLKAQITLGRDS